MFPHTTDSLGQCLSTYSFYFIFFSFSFSILGQMVSNPFNMFFLQKLLRDLMMASLSLGICMHISIRTINLILSSEFQSSSVSRLQHCTNTSFSDFYTPSEFNPLSIMFSTSMILLRLRVLKQSITSFSRAIWKLWRADVLLNWAIQVIPPFNSPFPLPCQNFESSDFSLYALIYFTINSLTSLMCLFLNLVIMVSVSSKQNTFLFFPSPVMMKLFSTFLMSRSKGPQKNEWTRGLTGSNILSTITMVTSSECPVFFLGFPLMSSARTLAIPQQRGFVRQCISQELFENSLGLARMNRFLAIFSTNSLFSSKLSDSSILSVQRFSVKNTRFRWNS